MLFGLIYGVVVLTTKLSVLDTALVLLAASFAVAVKLCVPSINVDVGTNDQWPLASTTVEPIVDVPSTTVTVDPACAVPVIAGLLLAMIGLF